MKRDLEEIQEYIKETLPKIKVHYIAEEKLVLHDEITGEKICVFDKGIVGKNLTENYVISDLNSIEKNNKHFIKIGESGFFYKGHLEVLLMYNHFKDSILEDDKINIGQPSDLFKVVYSNFENDDYFVGWDVYKTIKISSVAREKIEEEVQKVLFILNYYFPSIYKEDVPRIEKLFYDGDEFTDTAFERQEEGFPTTLTFVYEEPIAFFNEAKKMKGNLLSFLYYYKILEYFFIKSRKEEIKNQIEDYNRNTNANKLDTFIDEITKLYKEDEQSCLEILFNNTEIKENVIALIEDYYDKGFLETKDLKDFSTEIYKYRNSIVHGKSDYKFDIQLPKIFECQNQKKWLIIIEKIALLIIEAFCIKE